MSQFRFVFVVFCFTAVLIFTVYLRSAGNQVFYQLCSCNVEQSRLKQELGAKQLRLEGMINPSAISRRMRESPAGKPPASPPEERRTNPKPARKSSR
jgi:cytochrome c-type biogenesis protein CcmE